MDFIPSDSVTTIFAGMWYDGDSETCPVEGDYTFGVEVAGEYKVLDAKDFYNVSFYTSTSSDKAVDLLNFRRQLSRSVDIFSD